METMAYTAQNTITASTSRLYREEGKSLENTRYKCNSTSIFTGMEDRVHRRPKCSPISRDLE
jgi:hypothetical protein